MCSWFRQHFRRSKSGRSDRGKQSQSTSGEANVTEELPSVTLSLTTTPALSRIEPEHLREPSASLSSSSIALPVISRTGSNSVQDDGSRRYFWRDAFQVLQNDEGNRKLLDTYQKVLQEESGMAQPDADEAPDYLSKTINRNLELINEQRWKIQMGHTTVEVKTALNNVAKAAQYAQSFVGSMVSGEPHAAMAWAGVSLFLPLIINAAEQPKELIKGVDYISDIICRFSVTERLYREQITSVPLVTVTTDTAELRKNFEKHLTEFYAQVLLYQCRAIKRLKSLKVTGVARDIIKADDWNALLTELKDYETRCARFTDVLDSEKLERELQNFDENMSMISTHVLASIALQHQTKETVDKVKYNQDLQTEQHRTDQENACVQAFYVSPYREQMNRNPDAAEEPAVGYLKTQTTTIGKTRCHLRSCGFLLALVVENQ